MKLWVSWQHNFLITWNCELLKEYLVRWSQLTYNWQNESTLYTRLYLRHYKTWGHEYCVVLIINAKHWIVELWVKIRLKYGRWMWAAVLCYVNKEKYCSCIITYAFTCIGISATFSLRLHAAMMSCAKSMYASNRFFSKNIPIWRSATVH